MALIRWDPFREVDTMKDSWTPSVDIYETESEIVIQAEVPGMEVKDIGITLENNVLTLRGARRFENETKSENYHRVERSYGNFSRSFALPVSVSDANVCAVYKDGMLKISLPKKEDAKSKQIKVTAA